MRRPRMRASELQFRCLGCVVATFLFVSVFALSLRAPSPSLVELDDWADDGPPTAIVAPVVSSECDGFGLSSPLPPAPPGALSLFSLGDWGVRGMAVGSDAQLAVAWGMTCAAQREAPRAVFTLGDNFYGNGVSSVDDPQFEFKWTRVYTDQALAVPWYPTLGDHDQCGDVDAQVQFSKKDERWQMPSAYYEKTFAFDGGVVSVIFVDWVRLEGRFSETSKDRRFGDLLREDQAGKATSNKHWEWLRETLSTENPTWRVVVGHRPVISVAARSARDALEFPAEARTRKALRELMEKTGVDLWINGHDHTVQVACSGTEKSKTYFVTAGVGGYDLHELSPRNDWPAETEFADSTFHGFQAHRFTKDTITTHFLDEKAEVRHTFVIDKHTTKCPTGVSTKATVDNNAAGGL